MMKEYTFKPASQMVDVLEGSALELQVKATRVAYRSEVMINVGTFVQSEMSCDVQKYCIISCSTSSALAMEILQSYTEPSKWSLA